ncbi:thiamine pyrophosphate-binding protein, partial [Candidatus Bathyarchaeota archaeon]|nr:thiamine pyrophosphate-binding protein [Candidatus Bathyarchaeota archaeon]
MAASSITMKSPFTFKVAKRDWPEAYWREKSFLLINNIISAAWTIIFIANALIFLLGMPYNIVLSNALIALGIVFSIIFPLKAHTWIQSGCFGPMGYAIPAAIACRLALRGANRDVVAICGDGGFYMSMHEIATSIQENAPILICIFNDGALGTIKHQQKGLYGGRFISVNLKNPCFADIAEAFGAHGISVERLSQIGPAFEDGLKNVRNGETTIIDIRIDGEEPLPP